jgi:DNA-binding transcriptional ArsR family regulator
MSSQALAKASVRAPAKPQTKARDLDIDTMLNNARMASEFLKALSHEARLVILCLLVDGEKSVTEIEQTLSLRQPAVSQQLARLRADGLVDTRRDGKNIYYSLAKAEVRDVIMALHAAFCKPKRGR